MSESFVIFQFPVHLQILFLFADLPDLPKIKKKICDYNFVHHKFLQKRLYIILQQIMFFFCVYSNLEEITVAVTYTFAGSEAEPGAQVHSVEVQEEPVGAPHPGAAPRHLLLHTLRGEPAPPTSYLPPATWKYVTLSHNSGTYCYLQYLEFLIYSIGHNRPYPS